MQSPLATRARQPRSIPCMDLAHPPALVWLKESAEGGACCSISDARALGAGQTCGFIEVVPGCRHLYYQGIGREQKWHLPAPPSLKQVLTGHFPSGRCFKISKLISFTYGPGTSLTTAFALSLKISGSHTIHKRSILDPHSPHIF